MIQRNTDYNNSVFFNYLLFINHTSTLEMDYFPGIAAFPSRNAAFPRENSTGESKKNTQQMEYFSRTMCS